MFQHISLFLHYQSVLTCLQFDTLNFSLDIYKLHNKLNGELSSIMYVIFMSKPPN
jgi:hypothetical protein